jgi:hypothetical protein
VKDFTAPEGVQAVLIDPESLQLATPSCPTTREEVYVAGSAPTQFCELHGGHNSATTSGNWLSHIFGGGESKTQTATNNQPVASSDEGGPATTQAGDPPDKPSDKKKSPLAKIFGIFGGKKKDPDKAKPNPDE